MSKQPIRIGAAGKAVADNVRALRRSRELTQGELAEQVQRAGRDLARPAITEIEVYTRRVDVDDLVALARVFEVSPEAMIKPLTISESREDRPKRSQRAKARR